MKNQLPTPDMDDKPLFKAIEKFFVAVRKGTKCPNCGGKKKEGAMVCRKCDETSQAIVRQLQKGITVEYADGTKEKLVGTKNPRKSTIYNRKR